MMTLRCMLLFLLAGCASPKQVPDIEKALRTWQQNVELGYSTHSERERVKFALEEYDRTHSTEAKLSLVELINQLVVPAVP